MPTAGSSPSARTTGNRTPAAPSPACPGEDAASSPGSAIADAAARLTGVPYRFGVEPAEDDDVELVRDLRAILAARDHG